MRELNRFWVVAMLCAAVTSASFGGDCGCHVGVRIIDGMNVASSTFPTVGQIGDSRGGLYCTGTLIAPRFVLSAAHCVVDARTGKLLLGQTDGRFVLGGVTYKTSHIYVHPTYMGDASQEKEFAIDLSIFELDQEVPDVQVSPLNRREPKVGALLTLVGYGEQGTGAKGVDGTFPTAGTVNTGTTPIDVVTGTFIKWNFEKKTTAPTESNTAPGDSGGPQFIQINSQLLLASVTSGGNRNNAGFGDVSYNTRVDIATGWIDSITGGMVAEGNHAPTIDSLAPSSVNPNAREEVTFSVSATDVDGDDLRFHWFFGDGTEDINGSPNETHVYPTDGTYAVQLVVTDGRGGSASMDLTLKVGLGITVVPVVMSEVSKQKFLLNFLNSARDTLEFTLTHPDFVYSSAQTFNTLVNGTTVKVYIDRTQIDGITFIGMRPIGLGTVKLNFRSGSLRYTVRNNAKLTGLLQAFGAINDDVSRSITVPVRIQIGNTRYGADAVFQYNARINRTGIGKQ